MNEARKKKTKNVRGQRPRELKTELETERVSEKNGARDTARQWAAGRQREGDHRERSTESRRGRPGRACGDIAYGFIDA